MGYKSQYIDYFAYCAGGLLLLTAMAKIVAACGSARILQMPDPVLAISYRCEFWTTGVIEIIVATACFISKSQKIKAGLLVWLASNFALYRLALSSIGVPRYCHCMGNFFDALHISPQVANIVMMSALAYLLIGNYAAFYLLWQHSQKTSQANVTRACSE